MAGSPSATALRATAPQDRLKVPEPAALILDARESNFEDVASQITPADSVPPRLVFLSRVVLPPLLSPWHSDMTYP